jgi:hypothetical protein
VIREIREIQALKVSKAQQGKMALTERMDIHL